MKHQYLSILIVTASLAMTGSALAKNDKDNGNGKSESLPPGLLKKVDQGKPLPPGWQKKLSRGDILDRDIYSRGKVVVPIGKDGTVSIDVDGTVIRLMENTREIVDILKR